MQRTFVIGDVHGCAQELEDLLAACAHSGGDRVLMVGDLVAKGPDSPGVLALLRRIGASAVRGNHDQAVLRWHDAVVQGVAPARGPHHLKVARQLSAEDWDQLARLPLYLRVPEHALVVVHAGLVPGVALEAQSPDLLMNMRTLRPDGTASRRPEDGELWGARWPGPELVVFGHHATAGLQRHPHAIGIDTGCVYGGKLTAYVLPDDRFVSVPARKVYAPLDADRPGVA
jgi:diadenosine tetraphosphatase ApaH/serine/threonine PP2A family protein phosphatase